LLKKPLESRWRKELKLRDLKENRKLKSTDLSKNVLNWNMKLEWKPKEKKERLRLKQLDSNKRKESRHIEKSKS
jgi:hypothetical protein